LALIHGALSNCWPSPLTRECRESESFFDHLEMVLLDSLPLGPAFFSLYYAEELFGIGGTRAVPDTPPYTQHTSLSGLSRLVPQAARLCLDLTWSLRIALFCCPSYALPIPRSYFQRGLSNWAALQAFSPTPRCTITLFEKRLFSCPVLPQIPSQTLDIFARPWAYLLRRLLRMLWDGIFPFWLSISLLWTGCVHSFRCLPGILAV